MDKSFIGAFMSSFLLVATIIISNSFMIWLSIGFLYLTFSAIKKIGLIGDN